MKGPVRGEGAPITVRTAEDDENVEYLDADDAVRFVKAWRSGDEPVYETQSFDEWGETRALRAAAQAAAEHVRDELDTDGITSTVSTTVGRRDRVPVVSIVTTLGADDEVQRPDITFDTLVATTPSAVTAIYALADREYELETPVYARHEVRRPRFLGTR